MAQETVIQRLEREWQEADQAERDHRPALAAVQETVKAAARAMASAKEAFTPNDYCPPLGTSEAVDAANLGRCLGYIPCRSARKEERSSEKRWAN